MSFDHPVLSALLLSKVAQAAEAGIEMTVDTAGLTSRLGGDDRDLATILGNLVDNAFDALSRQDVLPENKRVHVHLSGAGERQDSRSRSATTVPASPRRTSTRSSNAAGRRSTTG